MRGELTGRCACGAVTYVLREGMRLKPYACHCTDCQARTGSAFSEHMLVARKDLELHGELDVGHLTQPSGARSSIHGCARCKTRIFAENDRAESFASLRCGTLDASRDIEPAAHVWVRSKQRWLILPPDAKQLDGQPQNQMEWLELVGLME